MRALVVGLTAIGVSAALLSAEAAAGSSTVAKNADSPYLSLAGLPPYPLENYTFDRFVDQTFSAPLEVGGAFAGVTALGIFSWEWGSSSFNFNNEGYFGKDTGSLGMDKLGHAYTSYLITELLTHGINHRAEDPQGAQITAAILAGGVMTYVEIFDGFSVDHGFSYEDMLFNAGGIGLSVLRSTFPELRNKLDFRMQYLPSGNKDGFHPITDYSGQKYFLALKLAGFEAFEETPLRFVELQAGYFARGFTDKEQDNGDDLEREPFVAVGLNLQELLFGYPGIRDTGVGRVGRTALEYIQVPYTYLPTAGTPGRD